MSPTGSIRYDKGIGVVIGAAVGDALGWPQEDRSQIVGGASARNIPAQPAFRRWIRNAGTQFGRYTDPVNAGEYSDDTQLMLAVARACFRGDDWWEWLTRVELPIWPSYERGGGGAVLSAARAWADGRPPWVPSNSRSEPKVTKYFNAGANGVAMRIAPHVLLKARGSVEEVLIRVVRDGLATHGHPRALVGACIHALAIRHALLHEGTLEYGELFEVIGQDDAWRDPTLLLASIDPGWDSSYFKLSGSKSDPVASWIHTCSEVDRLLDIALVGLARGATANDQQVLSDLGCFAKATRGSGTVTAVAALYVAARTAPRPMAGLMRTGFLQNADTDTLCSMTGSILGALHGADWMEVLAHSVQDREYLTMVGVGLAEAANGPRQLDEYRPAATTTSALKRWHDELFRTGDARVAPDGRGFRVVHMLELPTKTRSFVARAIGCTADGQTLFIDRLSRSPIQALEQLEQNAQAGDEHWTAQMVGEVSGQMPGVDADPGVGEPTVMSVELRVNNLDVSSKFFKEVLGFEIDRRGDKVHLGWSLVLSATREDLSGQVPLATVITISANDLESIAQRASEFPNAAAEWSQDGQALWLREPGLNVIRVVPRVAVMLEEGRSGADASSRHTSATGPSTRIEIPTPSAAETSYIQDALFDSETSLDVESDEPRASS